MKRKALLLVTGVALISGMGPTWVRPVMRPGCLPGIPERDYQPLAPGAPVSPLVQGVSFDGVELMPRAGEPVAKIKVRTFGLAEKSLKIHHCSVSQLAFTMEQDGRWVVNLRGDQNPWFYREPTALPPNKVGFAPGLETNHLIRNEFQVTVRCMGNFQQRDQAPQTGRPVLAVIGPINFMVQRGVPYVGSFNGVNPDLARYFAVIDRAEFSFVYR